MLQIAGGILIAFVVLAIFGLVLDYFCP